MPKTNDEINAYNKKIEFPNILMRKIEDPKVQKFILDIYELFGADLDGDVMSVAELIKKLVQNE